MRIRTRLLLGLLVIFAAGAYFLLDPILDRLEQQYLEAVEEPMVDTANILATMVERDIKDDRVSPEPLRIAFNTVRERMLSARIYDVVKTRVVMRVYVTDERGIVVFDSDHGHDEGADYSGMRDVALTLRGAYGARSSARDSKDSLASTMFVAAPVKSAEGRIIGVLTVAKPQRSVEEFIAVSRDKIIVGAVGTGAVLALAAWLLSHWVTIPIRRLTDYADALKSGQRVRFPKLSGIEVRTLGKSFEEMRDALEGRRYAEDYIRTLTHEIKSPLSAIRGASELLREDMPRAQQDRFLENILTQTARIQRIIDQLLQLATVESQKSLAHSEVVDLNEIAALVVETMMDAANARRITLVHETCADAEARCDRQLVEMALRNMVQNAVEFSPQDSTVQVRAQAGDRSVELIVDDEGAGIPDYAVSRVFDRFYSLQRPGTNEKSSGLGLCFVKEVADLHGGEARIANREARGTRATLLIPR
jgi:two-component system sensor histidine kinase CreC